MAVIRIGEYVDGNQSELLYPRQREFKQFLEEKIQRDGGISISKEAGIFICRK